MCGIAGTFNYGSNGGSALPGLVERMCAVMTHRGPDDCGTHVDGPLGMGMRRLSIIDVAGGRQPITNEDGAVIVVYNGEIYNFKELYAVLKGLGHEFRTRSDTEVVVHAYEEWGTGCLGRFRGMFAFSLWDGRRRTLFIARDQMGVKPLYYMDNGKKLNWASEAKSLLVDPEYEIRPNMRALGDYLRFRFVPAPETFFQGIRKLPPGHYMLCKDGGAPSVVQYWDVPAGGRPGPARPEPEYAAELAERLEESVRMQMVSEVPVGAFLSGGLDSSSIVGLMSGSSAGPVKTFSVGFGVGEPVDELAHARKVAAHFRTDHHELTVEPSSFDLLSRIVWHLDEPVADPAAVPTYLLSSFARRHVTVVLTGEGADELFAGYRKYYWHRAIKRFRRLPEGIRRVLLAGFGSAPLFSGRKKRKLIEWACAPDGARIIDMMSDLNAEEVSGLLADPAASLGPGGGIARMPIHGDDDNGDDLSLIQYLDAKTWLPDDLLTKVDRMTMAASLEARVPFLDHTLVEFAMSVPASLRLKGSVEKHVLRRAVAKMLPPDILKRKKHVFSVPFDQWFNGDLKAFLSDILCDPRTANRGYVNRRAVERMLDGFGGGQASLSQPLFTLLVLELWSRVFLDMDGEGAAIGRLRRRAPAP